jgi:hypothetical protein
MPRWPLLAILPAVTGCAGGAALEASIEAPSIEISAADSMKELRFRAEAHTSDRVAAGFVRVVVDPEGASGDGQMRVTVYRGPESVADPAPENGVVPCAADVPVAVLRDAMGGCAGDCEEQFVVVFAAEGLAAEPVTFPVVVEAELAYEHADEAVAGDFLELTLE